MGAQVRAYFHVSYGSPFEVPIIMNQSTAVTNSQSSASSQVTSSNPGSVSPQSNPSVTLAAQGDTRVEDYLKGLNGTQQKILGYLSSGSVTNQEVAEACGVTPAYISQLMAEPMFSEIVSQRRYERLSKKNTIDDNWDDMELVLQSKLKRSLSMIIKPGEILNAIKVVNSAQRRGSGRVSNSNTQTAPQVVLTLPTVILNKLEVDRITNKVIEANGMPMITATSQDLNRLYNEKVIENGQRFEGKDLRPIRDKRQAISADDL